MPVGPDPPVPGGAPIVLYDGSCGFCTSQAQRLARRAKGGLILRSFREEGVLAGFPSLSLAECEREMKLVDPSGRVYGGAEALVKALSLGRPFVSKLMLVYYLPLIRWLCDRAYSSIARNRFRLSGQSPVCEEGTCSVHKTSSTGPGT